MWQNGIKDCEEENNNINMFAKVIVPLWKVLKKE
jgi:hypothetical protein